MLWRAPDESAHLDAIITQVSARRSRNRILGPMLVPHPSESEAWHRAHAAAAIPGVPLQALASVDDADRIVRVMEATWAEAPPRDLIRALAGSGNAPIGAFDGADLIGFALGWAAVDPEDGLHMYSHMLAALPDRRHRGVGFALKLAQRALALDQGFRLMRWTFDPLVPRNAHLNLRKLGAIADRFERDTTAR
jgi:predicted GNAT superfamily acetyltransferase